MPGGKQILFLANHTWVCLKKIIKIRSYIIILMCDTDFAINQGNQFCYLHFMWLYFFPVLLCYLIFFLYSFSICCFADCSSSFSLLRCFPGALIFGALYMLPPPVFFSYCYPGNSFPASCFGPGERLLFSHFLLCSSDLRQLSWFILA